MTEPRDFYKDLHENKDANKTGDVIHNFIRNLNIPQLSDNHRQRCEGLLPNAKCFEARNKFKSHKSPDNDGDLLVNSLNVAYMHGKL